MSVAVVGELVVGGWKLLEALECDGVEVAAEFSVLSENHGSARDEGVDQRSLVLVVPHFLLLLIPDLGSNQWLLFSAECCRIETFLLNRRLFLPFPFPFLPFFPFLFFSTLFQWREYRKRNRERERGFREFYREIPMLISRVFNC